MTLHRCRDFKRISQNENQRDITMLQIDAVSHPRGVTFFNIWAAPKVNHPAGKAFYSDVKRLSSLVLLFFQFLFFFSHVLESPLRKYTVLQRYLMFLGLCLCGLYIIQMLTLNIFLSQIVIFKGLDSNFFSAVVFGFHRLFLSLEN